jgi:hypothetical protein
MVNNEILSVIFFFEGYFGGVAKSVAKTGAFCRPAYGKKKCNRELATAWTEWRYLPSR